MAIEIIEDYKPIIDNISNFKYRYFVFLSGRGGLAKSTNIANCLLISGLMKPLRIVCCREHMTSIKDSVHSQLADIIKEHGLPYKVCNDSIKAPNGTSFIFKGLREIGVQDIKSLANANIAWIEEGSSISKKSFDALVPTIRTKDSFIVISANPETESDIVYQYWGQEAPRRDDSYVCYKDFRYNPFPLEKSLLHDIVLLKKNRPSDYENIYLGKLRNNCENPVVKSWTEENIGVGKTSQKIYWSLDFNINPQCSVIAHWNGGNDFYFSDEIVLENVATDTVAEYFCALWREKYQNMCVVINGDAAGRNRSSHSEYSNYAIIEQVLLKHKIPFEINVPRANTSISNRVANFDWHVKGIDGKRHILVNQECKHLIHACKMLGYDKHGKIEELPFEVGMKTIDYAKSHIYDAASYCVMINDPVLQGVYIKPKPQILSLKERFLNDVKRFSHNGEAS